MNTSKIITLCLILTACSAPTQPDMIIQQAAPPPPVIPPVIINPVTMALYDGFDLIFYDGQEFNTAYSGVTVAAAGNRTFAIDDILYQFDENGAVLASSHLSLTPNGIFINGADTWLFDEIPAEIAQSMGGLRKIYTHVFKNGVEIAPWYTYDNDFNSAYGLGDMVVMKDSGGLFYNLTGSEPVHRAYNALIIHSVNYGTKQAVMNGQTVSFLENHFYTSRWQPCGDKWLSDRGLTFSAAAGLNEHDTALDDFIGSVIYPAGEHTENSESVSYWINAETGELIRYVPSIDQYAVLPALFPGPADSPGTLDPFWMGDKMYFHHAGSVKVYDPAMGSVNVFCVDMEVWEW